jgi:transcriptional regulator with XRE-family HTH domain
MGDLAHYSLSQYLDELKKIKGLEKDSDLARFLKVSRAHISQIRGGIYMGEVKCFEVAKLLNREPLELLSLNRAIRNKDRKVQEYWLTVHRKTLEH